MYFEFESANGEKVTVSYLDADTVVYSVGNRKTTFSISDCSEYTFTYCKGTSHKLICGEDGIEQTHLIILHGENRIQKNNDKKETRRHESINDYNDKHKDTTDMNVNIEENIMRKIAVFKLYESIQKLKPSEQELIYKLYLDESTMLQSELAKKLNVTENTIKQRIKRIRKKLKRLI